MRTQIVAHRGLHTSFVENTLASLEAAIAAGIPKVEFDVMMSADGQLFVHHDTVMGRLCSQLKGRNFEHCTAKELASVRIGKQPLPTLAQWLECSRGKIQLMLEIKRCYANTTRLVAGVLAELQAAQIAPKDCQIGSFSLPVLEDAKRARSPYPLLGIVERQDVLKKMLSMDLPELSLGGPLLKTATLARVAKEKPFYVWTINDPAAAAAYKSLGAKGIITNDPLAVAKAL